MSAASESLCFLDLDNRPLAYRLSRSKRRSLSIHIDHDGVQVRAPNRYPLYEIEHALRERAVWIFSTLHWWRQHRRCLADPDWQDGAAIPYRGETLILHIQRQSSSFVTRDLFGITLAINNNHKADIARAIMSWWWQEAERILIPQVYGEAAKIGQTPAKVLLSRARRQWGSCNTRREIRINWRLILLPPQLATDIIAHEVAHLCEMNHSPRFWALLEQLRPGIRNRESALAEWQTLLAA